jgi:hypothetical protein
MTRGGWTVEERNSAEGYQEQSRKSGVVAQQQEFAMDLLHAWVVVHLLVQRYRCRCRCP